jgi:hypothetical protein
MALELYDGSLRDISGKFNEDEVFKIEMRSWRILKAISLQREACYRYSVKTMN